MLASLCALRAQGSTTELVGGALSAVLISRQLDQRAGSSLRRRLDHQAVSAAFSRARAFG